jgi:hypothetical protein
MLMFNEIILFKIVLNLKIIFIIIIINNYKNG